LTLKSILTIAAVAVVVVIVWTGEFRPRMFAA
jgi:hypothetical protein